jgi:hypothetical protein
MIIADLEEQYVCCYAVNPYLMLSQGTKGGIHGNNNEEGTR